MTCMIYNITIISIGYQGVLWKLTNIAESAI